MAGFRAWLAMGLMVAAVAATPARAAMDPADLCGIETRRLEQERGIPDGLLTAISLVESGRWDSARRASFAWPYTVMAEGRGRFLPSKAAAIAEVLALRQKGVRNIDVGCMQINLQAHPTAFKDLNAAFDARVNVAYAAKFLVDLYRETGSWATAGTHYHSRTPVRAAAYRTKLALAWHKTQQGGSASLATRRAQGEAYADSRHVRMITPGKASSAKPGAMPVVYHSLNSKLTEQRAAQREKLETDRAAARQAAETWRQEKLADWYVRKIKRD